MSKIDELAELISGIADQIDTAAQAGSASALEAEQVGSTAAALGAEGMAEVKSQLDALTAGLVGPWSTVPREGRIVFCHPSSALASGS
ncbi:hypothetical protein [Kineosporia babensis]|uniref:Uncharacterized protein n=1 Tax=Kineosporia babensis TaxID=499548 RepID=A0A9X1NP44_9ACTN|nr:hypothetical protein [Kineosporia babensis]MCD5316638.1 hypothetical protein [Kineosporia babensis]